MDQKGISAFARVQEVEQHGGRTHTSVSAARAEQVDDQFPLRVPADESSHIADELLKCMTLSKAPQDPRMTTHMISEILKVSLGSEKWRLSTCKIIAPGNSGLARWVQRTPDVTKRTLSALSRF